MLLNHSDPAIQVDRILQSDTFRASGVLRRLLRFLADKALSGQADQLKEYSIGVDAFGKPATYDPRQDAIVRLQIGRLRQKLGEYYRTEGKDDPVVLDLPKGHFKLRWEARPEPTEAGGIETIPRDKPDQIRLWRFATIALAVALLISACWGTYSTALLGRARNSQTESVAWTPELEQLWRPFLTSKRPLVISVADPLFIGLEGTDIFFRKISLRRPEDAESSLELSVLRKSVGNPKMQTAFNFTPTGELVSSFLVGKLLGSRRQDIRLARSSQLPLQELADNNVILIGPEIVFDQKLPGIQLQPQLVQTPEGIRNLRPQLGEQAFYADKRPGPAPNDGEVYALISHGPGPLAKTDIQSFTSNRTWGREGAVQAFTDLALARTLVSRLRKPSGDIPRYYQILVRVTFNDGIPTDVSYVLHRDLTPRQGDAGGREH